MKFSQFGGLFKRKSKKFKQRPNTTVTNQSPKVPSGGKYTLGNGALGNMILGRNE